VNWRTAPRVDPTVSRVQTFSRSSFSSRSRLSARQLFTTVPIGGVKLAPPVLLLDANGRRGAHRQMVCRGHDLGSTCGSRVVDPCSPSSSVRSPASLIGFVRAAAAGGGGLDPYVKMINALPAGRAGTDLRALARPRIWSKVALGVTLVFFIVFFKRLSGREGGEPDRAPPMPACWA